MILVGVSPLSWSKKDLRLVARLEALTSCHNTLEQGINKQCSLTSSQHLYVGEQIYLQIIHQYWNSVPMKT